MFRKRDIEIDNRNQCFKDLLCSLQEPMLIQWQPPKWHLEPTKISALEVEQALQILQVLLRVIVNISQDITKVQEVVEAIVTIIITINLSTQFIGFAKVSGCQTTPLWGGQWPIGKTTSTPFGLLGTDVFFFSVIHGVVSLFWIPGLRDLPIKVWINGDFSCNVSKIWIKVFGNSILDSMWFVGSRLTPCQTCSNNGTRRIYHLKRIRNLMEESGIKISWPCARKWESKWWQKKVIHSTIWTSIPFGLHS